MGCNCGGRNRERWIVVLPSGMKITKSSENQAKAMAAKTPGATYHKAG
jgi:hypothetical protein